MGNRITSRAQTLTEPSSEIALPPPEITHHPTSICEDDFNQNSGLAKDDPVFAILDNTPEEDHGQNDTNETIVDDQIVDEPVPCLFEEIANQSKEKQVEAFDCGSQDEEKITEPIGAAVTEPIEEILLESNEEITELELTAQELYKSALDSGATIQCQPLIMLDRREVSNYLETTESQSKVSVVTNILDLSILDESSFCRMYDEESLEEKEEDGEPIEWFDDVSVKTVRRIPRSMIQLHSVPSSSHHSQRKTTVKPINRKCDTFAKYQVAFKSVRKYVKGKKPSKAEIELAFECVLGVEVKKKCKECGEAVPENQCREHYQNHHKPFTCIYDEAKCHEKFSSKLNCHKHILEHHLQVRTTKRKKFECKTIPKTRIALKIQDGTNLDSKLDDFDKLLKFNGTEMENTRKVLDLAKKYILKKPRPERRKFFEKIKPFEYKCCVCGDFFMDMSTSHIDKHLRTYICNFDSSNCSLDFATMTSCTDHIVAEHLKFRFSCPSCNTTFSNLYTLQYHNLAKHKNSSNL